MSSTFDDDEDGIEAPAPKSKPKPYRPTRRAALVSHPSTVGSEKKEIKVVPKSEQAIAKIREITNTNFLFSRLDAQQKQTIIDAMFPVEKKAGDIIIKQGDKGDNFYVLDSGEVDVLIAKPKAPGDKEEPKPVKVGVMVAGQGFGELALLHNCPRAATIKATKDCSLWAIDQVTYRQVMMQSVLQKRNKYLDFISKVPFFDKLDRYQRGSVCDALTEEDFKQDINVVVQGDTGNRFFIIEEGTLDVLITGADKKTICVGTMKPPQFFGEIALLNPDAKRAATVRTKTATKLLVLEKEAFNRLLGPIEGEFRENILHYSKTAKK